MALAVLPTRGYVWHPLMCREDNLYRAVFSGAVFREHVPSLPLCALHKRDRDAPLPADVVWGAVVFWSVFFKGALTTFFESALTGATERMMDVPPDYRPPSGTPQKAMNRPSYRFQTYTRAHLNLPVQGEASSAHATLAPGVTRMRTCSHTLM